MGYWSSRLRAAPVIPLFGLTAFSTHQLRYLVGGGTIAPESHGYMSVAIAILLPLALSLVAARLVTASGRENSSGFRLGAKTVSTDSSGGWGRLARVSLWCVALLTAFGLQEVLEAALLSHGAVAALHVVGSGVWVVVPLSAFLGLALTLLLEMLDVVEHRIAAGRSRRHRRRAPSIVGRPRGLRTPSLMGAALVFGFARRPPPVCLGSD
jgi:hypothetical protein